MLLHYQQSPRVVREWLRLDVVNSKHEMVDEAYST